MQYAQMEMTSNKNINTTSNINAIDKKGGIWKERENNIFIVNVLLKTEWCFYLLILCLTDFLINSILQSIVSSRILRYKITLINLIKDRFVIKIQCREYILNIGGPRNNKR